MRIIAGEHRGRLLKSPPDERTRPMLDRIREAVFSSLGERVDGARVLDLFAGTGSLALEALSRGASFARMIERDPKILKLLRENVDALAMKERVEIAGVDALRDTNWVSKASPGPFDIAFVDAPYPLLGGAATRRLLLNALEHLVRGHLAPGAVAVFHAPHAAVDSVEFAAAIASNLRSYGTSDIWYLRAAEAA